MDMLTHIFSPFLPRTTVMGNYRPINGYVDTHTFLPVFTVLRTYILVTTVPITGYVDTHIFTTCRIYCIKV